MSDTNNINIKNTEPKPTEVPNLQAIMKKIETDVNPKTMSEGLVL